MEQNYKILLIEDEQFLIRFYQAELIQLGYKTVIVEDGGIAIEQAVTEQPNLIILDIMLPNKNGFEILKELKSIDSTKNIPVITLSQLAQETDLRELRKLGAYICLIKMDTQLTALINEVKKILPLKTIQV